MKNFLSWLLLIGLLIAGWMNRDKLSGLWTKAGTTPEEAQPSAAAATPHPAREAQARATALYPALTVPNSALNQKFLALYKESQSTNPALLSGPDWPLQLAERAVTSLSSPPVGVAVRAAKQVVVYTTSHCPYCVKAKQYLTQKGVPYREIDIERSSAGEAAYRQLGGNGVPLIMVGNTKVEGFDAKALDRLLF